MLIGVNASLVYNYEYTAFLYIIEKRKNKKSSLRLFVRDRRIGRVHTG